MTAEFKIKTGEHLIGTLYQSGDDFSFRYDIGWVSSPNDSFNLSPKLDRLTSFHSGAHVKNFFENLLPEQEIRKDIADKNKIDINDIGRLLTVLGKESAGAIQVYFDSGSDLVEERGEEYKTISIKELSDYINNSGTAIGFISELGIKPSLSGAQDKVSCIYNHEDQTISFPLKGAPTTHIIKPSPIVKEKKNKPLELAGLNEFVMMRLAQKIWPDTPDTLLYESKRDLYIVKRFDRERNNAGSVKRIHQFDLCQYFGISSKDKYEITSVMVKKGPFGLKDIYKAINETSLRPLEDLDKFLTWILFNYLIDNTDGHLKNISFIQTPDGIKLAPFYDLVSIGFYRYQKEPLFDQYYAFFIGSRATMDSIIAKNWEELAGNLELQKNELLIRMKKLSVILLENLVDVEEELIKELQLDKSKKQVKKICQFIRELIFSKADVNLKAMVEKNEECTNCKKNLKASQDKIFGMHLTCSNKKTNIMDLKK